MRRLVVPVGTAVLVGRDLEVGVYETGVATFALGEPDVDPQPSAPFSDVKIDIPLHTRARSRTALRTTPGPDPSATTTASAATLTATPARNHAWRLALVVFSSQNRRHLLLIFVADLPGLLARDVADLARLVVLDAGFVGDGGMDGNRAGDAFGVLGWRFGVDGLAVLALTGGYEERDRELPRKEPMRRMIERRVLTRLSIREKVLVQWQTNGFSPVCFLWGECRESVSMQFSS
jgi:hypothetical protein